MLGFNPEFAQVSTCGERVWVNCVLVVVANMFGMKSVDPCYFDAIQRYMRLPSFVGLIGGKPGNAYYFCGLIDSNNDK